MTQTLEETAPDREPAGPAACTPRERQILHACIEVLTDLGYERLTIDAVAARARASKATIYRRWPGKPALVADAVRLATDSAGFSADYSGDLRADLVTLVRDARNRLAGQGSLLAGMVSAMQHDAELAALMREDIRRCQAITATLLAHYVEDGTISNSDVELIRQLAPATVLTRLLITGESVDDEVIDRLVDNVLMPLLTLTSPAGLLQPECLVATTFRDDESRSATE